MYLHSCFCDRVMDECAPTLLTLTKIQRCRTKSWSYMYAQLSSCLSVMYMYVHLSYLGTLKCECAVYVFLTNMGRDVAVEATRSCLHVCSEATCNRPDKDLLNLSLGHTMSKSVTSQTKVSDTLLCVRMLDPGSQNKIRYY
jgi:hypothetical protein